MKFIRISSHPPLISVMIPLIVGIGTANALGPFFGMVLVVFFLLSYFFVAGPKIAGNPRAVIWIGSLACVWGFYCIARIEHGSLPPDHVVHWCNNSSYHIQGRVISFQEEYPEKIRIRLKVLGLAPEKEPDDFHKTVGTIFLSIYHHRQFRAGYGDVLSFDARLKPVRTFDNPGGFDYQTYLRRKKIYGLAHVNADQIRVHPCRAGPLKVVAAIETLRNRYDRFIRDSLGPRDSTSILSALITGKKRRIPTRIRDDFGRAGTSHLLAISGLHMSILALVFYRMFFFALSLFQSLLISGLAKKISMALTLVVLFLYSVFSGLSPSTQRAFVMIFVFMVSFMMEKEAQALNTLALAGILILVFDPPALFSVSFQLSFSAVLFILMGFDLVRHRGWIRGKGPGARVLTAGLVPVMAGLGTAPLVAFYFNIISHVQVPANLVLVPILGFVCLPLGFAGFFLFAFLPGISYVLVQSCGFLIDLCLTWTRFFVSLPYSWSRTVTPDLFALVLVYSFLGTLFWILRSDRKKTPLLLLGCILFAGAIHGGMEWQKRFRPDRLHVTVLDVGQGSSSLIHTPEGGTILVDGGGFSELSSFDPGRHVVAPFLWRENIKTLDMVILTHPESDHMNGLVFILNHFRVKQLIKNKDNRKTGSYRKMMDMCRAKKIPVLIPDHEPDPMVLDRVRLRFFPCSPLALGENFNDRSLVFQVQYQNFSMLFPGDIMLDRETNLAKAVGSLIKSTLLLSPHHGSSSSSNDFFLDLVNPESVIVSCGFSNRYGFPHPVVVDRYRARGFRIFRTDLNGAVTVVSDGRRYEVTTQRKDKPCFSSTSPIL